MTGGGRHRPDLVPLHLSFCTLGSCHNGRYFLARANGWPRGEWQLPFAFLTLCRSCSLTQLLLVLYTMPGKQLSLDTRREMWRYLQTHPEADGLKLQQRFDLKSSTAYRYLAKFSSSPDQATFCSGFRTGRCKKNSFGLDIKVARVLSGDCSLVLRGVKRKLRRQPRSSNILYYILQPAIRNMRVKERKV